MRFAFAGEEYPWDGKITVREAISIQKNTGGLGVNQIDAELARGNPEAIAAWMLVVMQRAGKAVRWEDIQNLDVRSYRAIPDEVEQRDETSGKAPDPTPAGTTHGGDEAPTL